jgi:hypothetical protein
VKASLVAFVAFGCTPTPYATATSHTRTGQRSYIIAVSGAHLDDARAAAYVDRRARELCPTGFDVVEIGHVQGSRSSKDSGCPVESRSGWQTRGGWHCIDAADDDGHVATISCRWHGL